MRGHATSGEGRQGGLFTSDRLAADHHLNILQIHPASEGQRAQRPVDRPVATVEIGTRQGDTGIADHRVSSELDTETARRLGGGDPSTLQCERTRQRKAGNRSGDREVTGALIVTRENDRNVVDQECPQELRLHPLGRRRAAQLRHANRKPGQRRRLLVSAAHDRLCPGERCRWGQLHRVHGTGEGPLGGTAIGT